MALKIKNEENFYKINSLNLNILKKEQLNQLFSLIDETTFTSNTDINNFSSKLPLIKPLTYKKLIEEGEIVNSFKNIELDSLIQEDVNFAFGILNRNNNQINNNQGIDLIIKDGIIIENGLQGLFLNSLGNQQFPIKKIDKYGCDRAYIKTIYLQDCEIEKYGLNVTSASDLPIIDIYGTIKSIKGSSALAGKCNLKEYNKEHPLILFKNNITLDSHTIEQIQSGSIVLPIDINTFTYYSCVNFGQNFFLGSKNYRPFENDGDQASKSARKNTICYVPKIKIKTSNSGNYETIQSKSNRYNIFKVLRQTNTIYNNDLETYWDKKYWWNNEEEMIREYLNDGVKGIKYASWEEPGKFYECYYENNELVKQEIERDTDLEG